MREDRLFRKDEDAVSGAVTATMIVATLTMVFAGIYAVVVPVWVENAESEHMRTVSNDLTNMKKSIDSQIEIGEKPITVSSTITLKADSTENWLGVEGETFLGELTVDPYSERFNITNMENPTEVYGTSQGSIYFISRNQYYPNQKYVYSNGAVIRVQDESGSGVMVAAPTFDVVDELGNRTLYFCTIRLTGEPTTISGSKSVSVQTKVVYSLVATYEGGLWDDGTNVTINATSNLGYIKIYERFYRESLEEMGFVEGTDFNLTRTFDSITLDIQNVNKIILYSGTIEAELR